MANKDRGLLSVAALDDKEGTTGTSIQRTAPPSNQHIPYPTALFDEGDQKPTSEEWESYKKRFDRYIKLSRALNNADISSEVESMLFVTFLGSEGIRFLENLGIGEDANKEEIIRKLDEHWSEKQNLHLSRYKFFAHNKQQEGQSIEDLVTEIVRKARQCNFNEIAQGKIEDVMMVLALIMGIGDEDLRQRLLQEEETQLTFKRATEIVKIRADLKKTNAEFSGYQPIHKINRFTSNRKPQSKQPPQQRQNPQQKEKAPNTKSSCYYCGKEYTKGHLEICSARDKTCSTCGKKGHFAKVCKSKQQGKQRVGATEDTFSFSKVQSNRKKSPNKKTTKAVEPNLPKSDYRSVQITIPSGGFASIKMEVDSAAPCVIIPNQLYTEKLSEYALFKSRYTFQGVGKSGELECIGFINAQMTVDDKTDVVQVYVCDSISKCLLGRNAMAKLQIIPDLAKMKVNSVKGGRYTLNKLKEDYPNCFKEGIGRIPNYKHMIRIKDGAQPVQVHQPRPIALAKRESVNKAIDKMDQQRISKPVECSEWVSHMLPREKADGTYRITGDYRQINENIIPEKFVQPGVDEVMTKMAGAKFFTQIDIRSAFFHMELSEKSKQYTTILTPKGLRCMEVLPQGMVSSPAAWQRFMAGMLGECSGVVWWMDDIIVTGKTQEEHDANLSKTMKKLNENDLRIQEEKLQLNVKEVDFAGFHINKDGIRPKESKIKAIVDAPEPADKKQIKSFLGMCTFYLSYLPNFATIAEPLRKLDRKESNFQFGQEERESFERIKKLMTEAPVLSIFDETAETILSTDASDYGVGAVLSQMQQGI